MKKSFSILFFFSTIQFSFAQEFTPPDSVAIINNHVKEIRIYYTGTGVVKNLQHTYRYNKKGQCIYSSEGSPNPGNYYYSYKYDSVGRNSKSIQRLISGEFVAAYDFKYFKSGKLLRAGYYSHNDSIHPYRVSDYDENGNIIADTYFSGKEFSEQKTMTYNSKNELMSTVDSIPKVRTTTVLANNRLVREIDYDSNYVLTSSWLLFYDANGKLTSNTHLKGGHKTEYAVIYSGNGYKILMNGLPATVSETKKWAYKWEYLTSPPESLTDATYNEQAVPTYKHELKRDAKGNITEDIISPSETWMIQKTVNFSYEYEYWK
ncbi:MAG: hypothetical protein HY064_05640 [Bacteroidetes bacterium]|nr:hypothetical protein [Bacteroidota bacterium]